MASALTGIRRVAPVVVLSVCSCASDSQTVKPVFVPANNYLDHSCGELAAEAERIEEVTHSTYRDLLEASGGDRAADEFGDIAIWRALYRLVGDGPDSRDVGLLRGQYEAIREASAIEGCGVTIATLEPKEPDMFDKKYSDAIRERNLACPRKMVSRGICRAAWYRENPGKAAIIQTPK